jgi:hypothetical protein
MTVKSEKGRVKRESEVGSWELGIGSGSRKLGIGSPKVEVQVASGFGLPASNQFYQRLIIKSHTSKQ